MVTRAWQRRISALAYLGLLGACADVDPGEDAAGTEGTEANETDELGTDPDDDDDEVDPTTSTTTSPSATAATSTANPTDGETTAAGSDESSGGEDEPPAGLPCDEPFTYNDRDACLTEVDGLQVKFFPLPERVRPARLVIFLHGDGGADWTENWGFRPEILDWAEPQDFMVMGIRSPASYDGSTEPAFGAAQPVHADMVATTIESFVGAYEVVEDRLLYWGVSGGSWFTSSSYLPVAGKRVPGIFVANCGGSGVSFGWEWDPETDPDTVALNSIYFNYGDEDFLAEPSAESFAEYTNLGFATGQLVHPGATHCAHPIAEPTIEFWANELE